MTIRNTINSMPLFWRINVFIAALLVFVVSLVEAILEPLAEFALADLYGGFQPWHEAVLWGVSILFPSLACSYIISKALSTKLGKMAKVAQSIAHGNLNARFSVTDNEKDAFDVLARSFNDMAGEIEKRINNERRLLADISHELRSPLARMTIAAELLPRKNGQEERADIIQRLNKEIAHMNSLVSLLLSQARDKCLSGEERGAIDLGEILKELADDFVFQGKAQNKSVESALQGNLRTTGDRLLLRRMFGNLLSNAMFYTPPNEKIIITAINSNDKIIVTIRDFGPGVPQEQLKDIFRAFYRVDDSRARTSGGVGLGLALASEAAVAHNGFIKAENAGPGLLLTAILPTNSPV